VRNTLICAAIAALGAQGLLALTARGNGWWDTITFVGYFIGTLVTRNPHSPSGLVVWLTIWLMMFAAIRALSWLVEVAWRKRSTARASRPTTG
jgi:hypothetical protein